MFRRIIIIIVVTITFLSGLYSCVRKDHDWISPCLPEPMDSIHTEVELLNILNGGYIHLPYAESYKLQNLYVRDDLRYLPYMVLMYTQTYLPHHVASQNECDLLDCCSANDSVLNNLGKYCRNRTDYVNQTLAGRKPIKRASGFDDELEDYVLEEDMEEDMEEWVRPKVMTKIGDRVYDLDSLRIRVVAHNDRSALEKLEQYYTEIKFPRELAVYYKVMLCYEGNGDLAERYYKVLKPYLRKYPEFLIGIRQVLLRAAYCDNNKRAQQLCDSLGFSLCDYRLPSPTE